MTGARMINAITTDLLKRGDGEGHETQIRRVVQYYSPEGRLLAETDAVHKGWVVMFDHLWPTIKGAISMPGREENWEPLLKLYRWMQAEVETWQMPIVPEGKPIAAEFLLGLEAMRRLISGDIPQDILATFVQPSTAKVPHSDPEALK